MTALTNDLLSQLSGPATQQIASQLGLDPQQASGAIGAALPLLLGVEAATLDRHAAPYLHADAAKRAAWRARLQEEIASSAALLQRLAQRPALLFTNDEHYCF